jgi:hypothetical protein
VYTVQCPEVKHNRHAEIRAQEGLSQTRGTTRAFPWARSWKIIEARHARRLRVLGLHICGRGSPVQFSVQLRVTPSRSALPRDRRGKKNRREDSDPQILGDTTQNVTVSRNSPTFYPRAPPHRRSESPRGENWGSVGQLRTGQQYGVSVIRPCGGRIVRTPYAMHACVRDHKQRK